jgi:hypothetical protein
VINPACFLASHGQMADGSEMPPCDGRLVRCHLIPQQMLRREFPTRAARYCANRATWVLGCGGPAGNGGHHGMLDSGMRPLYIPRSALPAAVEGFAKELDLMKEGQPFQAFLEREYGELIRWS